MSAISIAEAQARLPELIHQLKEGEEIIITDNGLPIAKLSAMKRPEPRTCQFGSAKGMLTILAEDDEHLKDFEDYMP